MNKILILIGGGKKPLMPFLEAGKSLGQEIKGASFNQLEFLTNKKKAVLKVENQDLADFDLIYLRVVGKRYEDAALIVQYAREKGIILVDKIFGEEGLIKLPLPKSLETRLLVKQGVPVPLTFFGSLAQIKEKGAKLLGFPFVVKGTTGKQGNAVWSPTNKEKLDILIKELREKEKHGSRFIAQKFIKASQRHRLLVVGNQVVGAITRPTRWRKRFLGKNAIPGERAAIFSISEKEKQLALKSAHVLGIDIGGVDIIKEDKTGRLFVLEVNSAPRWDSIKKDTGINVEKEVVKFLIKAAQERKPKS